MYDALSTASEASESDEEDACLTMTSSEFDRREDELRFVESSETTHTDDETTQVYDDPNGDVSSMYMMAGLIQSTRQYYNFETNNDDVATTAVVTANKKRDRGEESYDAPSYMHYNNLNYGANKAPSEDSEAMSSWTPTNSPLSNDLNDNRRKEIDNDNRSDGRSESLCSSEEESVSGSERGGESPSPYSMDVLDPLEAIAFSVIG